MTIKKNIITNISIEARSKIDAKRKTLTSKKWKGYSVVKIQELFSPKTKFKGESIGWGQYIVFLKEKTVSKK